MVLREAYRKDFLVEKHPLMGMRHRYLHLMYKAQQHRRKPIVVVASRPKRKRKINLSTKTVRKEDDKCILGEEVSNRLSDSVFEGDSSHEAVKIEI